MKLPKRPKNPTRTTLQPMRDNDTKGTRGDSAQDQFKALIQKHNPRTEIDHTPSLGHDFILRHPNGRETYVDVKEVNHAVSAGNGRLESGRVQIEKAEVKKWLDWEKQGKNRSAFMVVAVRGRDGSWTWRRAGAKKVQNLIKHKKDPVKLSKTELEKINTFHPGN